MFLPALNMIPYRKILVSVITFVQCMITIYVSNLKIWFPVKTP